MGPIGWQEMILILVVLLLLFGAKRLPEMGRSLGRGMREFKDAVTGSEKDEPERVQLAEPESGPSTTEDRPAEPESGSSTTEDRPAKPESERVSST
jgi:sec-independent protein translocase protein TatA